MKSLGSYTLGDQYVSPQRRLSAMLTQQGSRGGPSNSWQETMGRIAQQLAGAYIGYKDTQNRNKAFDAQTGLEPDSKRPPTNAEAMASPGMRDLQLQSMTGIAGDGQGSTVTAPLPDDQLMQQGGIPGTLDKISRYNSGLSGDSNRSADDILTDETLNAGIDLQAQNFINEMEQRRAASNVPRPRDFKAELAQRMQSYQQDPNNMVMNEKMNPRDYSMQQLRGLENNPYAKRILAQMMMQNADMDYERGLAQTARGYVDSDYERKREDDIEDRDKKLESDKTIANLKQSLPVTGIREYQQAVKLGLFKGSYEDYLQTKAGYGSNTPTGTTEKPAQVGGIPAGSPPWAGLPIKEQAKMKQSSYKVAAKMLEKNRQSLVSNKTMSDSFKRFAYLNAKQDKEAENEYFGTKTGSFIDRMPLGGLMTLDDDKREMEKISSLLTPQMRQGMPGAASDRDVAMFANATVGIDTPKGINDSLIAGMNARFENANDRQSFMEEFLTQNKHLNGAEQEWRGYLEANPIFDPDPALEGQYALNKSRQGYKEYFSGGGQGQGGQGRRSTDTQERRSTDIPEGVSKEQWGVMSPEQKALFK